MNTTVDMVLHKASVIMGPQIFQPCTVHRAPCTVQRLRATNATHVRRPGNTGGRVGKASRGRGGGEELSDTDRRVGKASSVFFVCNVNEIFAPLYRTIHHPRHSVVFVRRPLLGCNLFPAWFGLWSEAWGVWVCRGVDVSFSIISVGNNNL